MSRETISVERFEHSHWRKATREEFTELWEAECAAVPEFSESSFHIITGLLLPIWDRLPYADMRVYRFETDDGERVIGRLITPEALAPLYQAFGVDSAPGLSSPEAWRAVIDRGAVLDLAGDLQIRRSLVMGAHRDRAHRLFRRRRAAIEGARPHLGNHRLAPAPLRAGRRGSRTGILAALLDRHPLLRANARATA